MGDTVATDKFNLLNSKQENERLRSQIVRSPEKMKRVRVCACVRELGGCG